MKIIHILFATLALLFCGCASQQVPKSVIAFDLHAGTGKLSLPKDADITGLNVTVGTNNQVSVRVDHLTVKTNPDTIAASGTATALAIEATGNVAAKVAAASIQAAAQGAKTP